MQREACASTPMTPRKKLVRATRWSDVPAIDRKEVLRELRSFAEMYEEDAETYGASDDSEVQPISKRWARAYRLAIRELRGAARKGKRR